MRFSLQFLLAAFLLLSGLLAVVVHLRNTGSDALYAILIEYNDPDAPTFGWHYWIGESGYPREDAFLQRGVKNPDATWVQFVAGDTFDDITFLRCSTDDGFPRENEPFNWKELARNRSARNIRTLELDSFSSEVAPCFFRRWRLERLILRDSSIPESWRNALAHHPTIEQLVISGRGCNLDPEDVIKMPRLKSLTLSNRGITRLRLDQLRRDMPNVEIRLVGSYDLP